MKKIIPDVAETPIAETEPETEEGAAPKTLADGTEMVYALEDSGRNLPHLGLALEPGYIYVVGEDFDGTFGQRLVETGICRLAADHPEANTSEADKPQADKTKADEPEAGAPAAVMAPLSAEDKPSIQEAASIQEMVKAEVTRELAEQHQDAEAETAEHQS